ncbi:diaminopimelate epimerase [Salirhabdus euzebyi]|uniref:Diaminopimelate epimerase n=1 Tax=Salirhabdus euzebyi TaxID=394506 RepID=A0A841Q4Z3_9BACI|nr:diaminopimelate epimerase [Salirhabdus euzebyi]MBB6453430.1 diaminopimelate epimerase [Salirhabdus euzebyi]
MEISFTKMHGLGNNYIYVNTFEEPLQEEHLGAIAKSVSNVHTGIGSDGLILITPSDKAEIGMRIFNKDGSEGKNCGNGLRCVAKYAYDHQLVKGKSFHIETKAGIVEAHVQVEDGKVISITVDMGEPILSRKEIPMLGEDKSEVIKETFIANNTKLQVTAVSMGNPHAVFFVDDINQAPLYELGPIISTDDRFPEGVNVEFIEIMNPTEINFRVWERGSGVTEACGTGACAAVVAAVLNGYSNKEDEICVHLSGGDLWITWSIDNRVWMRGPAETVAKGVFIWES